MAQKEQEEGRTGFSVSARLVNRARHIKDQSIMGENSCPICLEPLLSSQSTEAIGTTVPCGHVFHVNCFGGWQAAKGDRCKCPNCNKPTKGFCKIFISLGQDDLATGEDDISLSSEESDDEEATDDEEQEPIDNEENAENADNTTNTDNDDETNQSSTENNYNSSDVVDLTMSLEKSPERIASFPLRRTKRKRKSKSHSEEKSDIDGGEANKLKRIAKRYKRQFQQKQSQCKEQYQKQTELVQKLSDTKSLYQNQEESMKELEERVHYQTLELENSRLLSTRQKNELDFVRKNNQSLRSDKAKTERQLQTLEASYQKDIEKACATSTAEVKEMQQRYPQVTEENRRLQEMLARLQRGDILREANDRDFSQKKTAKSIAKALRGMESARSIPMAKEKSNDTLESRIMSKYSVQAARMNAALQRPKKKAASAEVVSMLEPRQRKKSLTHTNTGLSKHNSKHLKPGPTPGIHLVRPRNMTESRQRSTSLNLGRKSLSSSQSRSTQSRKNPLFRRLPK